MENPGTDTVSPILDASTAPGYLARRGVLAPGVEPDQVVELGGGVSNLVILVEAGPSRLVLKQARGRLLVEQEWLADTSRALSEAAALAFAHQLTPGAVPEVLDVDAEYHALVMTAAPAHWGTWKEALLTGHIDTSVARRVGELSGTWHSLSSQGSMRPFDGLTAFCQLRIDPYHRSIAERHPDLAAPIELAISELVSEANRRCIVHGDLSPKNVLFGDGGLWVIDFEVAHRGNPTFDLAFLLTHLLLKSVHRPEDAARHRECAGAFLDGYAAIAGTSFVPFDEGLGLQIGCLLLARVDGKSPAEYLTGEGRKVARALGRSLVRDPVAPDQAWRWLAGVER